MGSSSKPLPNIAVLVLFAIPKPELVLLLLFSMPCLLCTGGKAQLWLAMEHREQGESSDG
jgi:hypothetical protein